MAKQTNGTSINANTKIVAGSNGILLFTRFTIG